MRTEDDSWDVTTSVGSTGLLVAAARALETQKADPLAIDPYAEVFCRAAGGEWADVLDGKLPDHYLTTGDFGEHFVNFQGARTRYFDEYFSRATAAGMKQVVILAAGLDSRAFRLQWPIGTTIFELDRPQVLDFKNAVLADYHIRPRAQRRSVAVDLRDEWQIALCNNGFEPTGRRLGSPRACWSISRPRPSSACLSASTPWLAPVATLLSRKQLHWTLANSQRSSNENAPRTPKATRAGSFKWSTTSGGRGPRNGSMSEAGARPLLHWPSICAASAERCPKPIPKLRQWSPL